jgi:hypothetical protein
MTEVAPQVEAKIDRDDIVAGKLDWPALLETALTIPGDTMGVYDRGHTYSFLNKVLLYSQNARGPVASYQGWQNMNRQVRRGEKGMTIIRPINVKVGEDNDGNDIRILRFKPVAGAFQFSQTDGEDIEWPEVPEWSLERALGNLGITQVPYEKVDVNTQGYSFDLNIAVSPIAAFPLKTALHEASHVQHGHTTPENLAEYETHRGRFEFEAEGSGYLALNEIGGITDDQASVSRGYIQGWMKGERPSDASIRSVFTVADKLVKAGRMAVGEMIEL